MLYTDIPFSEGIAPKPMAKNTAVPTAPVLYNKGI